MKLPHAHVMPDSPADVLHQAEHLPGMWRFEEVRRDSRAYFATAWLPTGPSVRSGRSGKGVTLIDAIRDMISEVRKDGRV